jgi:hypothetical protein
MLFTDTSLVFVRKPFLFVDRRQKIEEEEREDIKDRKTSF